MNQGGSWKAIWWKAQVYLVVAVLGVAFVRAPVSSIRLVGDIGEGIWWLGSGIGEGVDGVYDTADTADVEDLERRADLAERRAEAQRRLDDANAELPPEGQVTPAPDTDAEPDDTSSDGGGFGEGALVETSSDGGFCTQLNVWECCPALEPGLAQLPDCLAAAIPPEATATAAWSAYELAGGDP